MKRYFLISLTYLFIQTFNLSGQDSNKFFNNINIEGTYLRGFVIPHHYSINFLTKDFSQGFSMKISKQTTGENRWEYLHGYPEIGLILMHTYTGTKEFGSVTAIAPYGSFIITNTKYYKSFFNFGVGIAYVSKIWDFKTNNYNLAISSHVNAYISLGYENEFRINNKCSAIVEINFSHSSNGKIKTPNLGLNLPNVSLGFKYHINTNGNTDKIPEPYKFAKNEYSVFISTGIKEKNRLENEKINIWTIETNYYRQVSEKSLWGVGLDFFYDPTYNKVDFSTTNEYLKERQYKCGLHIAYDISFSKLRISFQEGYYIYSKYNKISAFYSRMEIKYQMKNHLQLKVAMKSHKFEADYTEFGIGYYFN